MSFTEKRIRAMMNRILSGLEHSIKCDLDQVGSDEEFKLGGDDILVLRNLVLDAGNDTIRSLPNTEPGPGSVRFERSTFPVFKHANIDMVPDEEEFLVPVITMRGEAAAMHEIRDKIGVGVVYNENGHTFYHCSGMDEIAYSVIPFLDKARMAKIVVANGEYGEWREAVIGLYRGED